MKIMAYRLIVGKLIYLSHTKPDVAYAVSVVSQFVHDPGIVQPAQRIVQYLPAWLLLMNIMHVLFRTFIVRGPK